ncbi:MAG: (Fe-S)-binding protein [Polyangiaceae bacterium]
MRPDQRPMVRLPQLEARRSELEKCVFCPKLCRTTCPVSNAEPRETLTPWGKMSMAYFSAHGDVEATASFADTAWACTGCGACKSFCDHKNEVGGTLMDARAALAATGLAPAAAMKTIASFDDHLAATERAAKEVARKSDARADGRTHVVTGCGYVRHASDSAVDIVRATAGLIGEPVALSPGCCGLPLLHAGDAKGFARQAERFAASLRDAERVVVADAGCALAIRQHYPAAGVTAPKIELFVELAATELARLRVIGSDVAIRWHDPCQLGRGLGVYEAPRAVLTRILGKAPAEFADRREKGACSGGGGLLPKTMPAVSQKIARARKDAHDTLGGGRIVTACASSLRSFRKAGAEADDISHWIAKAIEP